MSAISSVKLIAAKNHHNRHASHKPRTCDATSYLEVNAKHPENSKQIMVTNTENLNLEEPRPTHVSGCTSPDRPTETWDQRQVVFSACHGGAVVAADVETGELLW